MILGKEKYYKIPKKNFSPSYLSDPLRGKTRERKTRSRIWSLCGRRIQGRTRCSLQFPLNTLSIFWLQISSPALKFHPREELELLFLQWPCLNLHPVCPWILSATSMTTFGLVAFFRSWFFFSFFLLINCGGRTGHWVFELGRMHIFLFSAKLR